jgi:hypothetical protein
MLITLRATHRRARPSSPTGHHRIRQRPPAICVGQVEHRHRSDVPAQPAQACRPLIAGAPLQLPDICGACRRAAGRKLCIMPPARGLLPSRGGGGGAGSQKPNPSVHQQQGRPPVKLRSATRRAALPVRGWLRPNYDARSVIHSWQLARRNAGVDRAATNTAEAHQPEREPEEVPPRRGGRPYDQDDDWSPGPDGLGPARGPSIKYTAIPTALLTTHKHHQVHRGDESCYMVGRLPARLLGRRGRW